MFIFTFIKRILGIETEAKREPSNPDGHLNDWEIKATAKGLCPDCGGKLLYGPEGGMMVNAKCSKCGHMFNLALGGLAEFGHRLHS